MTHADKAMHKLRAQMSKQFHYCVRQARITTMKIGKRLDAVFRFIVLRLNWNMTQMLKVVVAETPQLQQIQFSKIEGCYPP